MSAFIDTLLGKHTLRTPLWLMRQAGRYLPEYRALREKAGSFMGLALTPDYATEVTLQPVRRFGMDAAILFSDILIVPYALGLDLTFAEGEGPRLSTVRNLAEIKQKLSLGSVLEKSAPVFAAVKQIAQSLPEYADLIGFAGSPWTIAAYMVEGRGSDSFALAKHWAYTDPENFDALIDIITDATITYLAAQIDAGASTVQLFDSWAALLDADGFRAYSIAPTRKIVTALKKQYPHVPIIGFPREVSLDLLVEYATQTGVDGLSVGWATDIGKVAAQIPPHITLQGNLDPHRLLIGGQQMVDTARRLVDGMTGRRYIFNLGHGVIKETPPEHVAALVDTVHR